MARPFVRGEGGGADFMLAFWFKTYQNYFGANRQMEVDDGVDTTFQCKWHMCADALLAFARMSVALQGLCA